MREYTVIGLGQFGTTVARTLIELGGVVIGIDADMKIVERLKDDLSQTICLDATDEDALRAAGVADVDTAVVALGDATEAAILATANLKNLGVGQIIARANSPLHERVLKLVGARRTYNPEERMASHVARAIISPDVHEVIPLSSGHSLVEVEAPRLWFGKTLAELHVRREHKLNIVGIKRRRLAVDDRGRSVVAYDLNDLPDADDAIADGDILLVVGSDDRIRSLKKLR